MIGAEGGFSSVQFLLASALGLLLMISMLNLVVVQYGRGALRSALEQGVRAGSLNGDVQVCLETVDSVIGQLLAGKMSEDLTFQCSLEPGGIAASASATFASWTPLTSDFRVELEGRALVEPP